MDNITKFWSVTDYNPAQNHSWSWNLTGTFSDNDADFINQSVSVILSKILDSTTPFNTNIIGDSVSTVSIVNSTGIENNINLNTSYSSADVLRHLVSNLNLTTMSNGNDASLNTSTELGDLNMTKTGQDAAKYDNDDEDEGNDESGLISDGVLDVIVLIDYVIISGIICFLGIIFNIINAIIFYRLGFGDTVNIMLFSLAITDLGALIPLLWKAVLFNPWFHDWDDLPFDYMTFQYYTGGWPHACFANISCLIIGFVTLDRYLCIAMPLKVRSIITPRRTVIIIVIFYVVLIGSMIPLFSTVAFGPIFFEEKNKTLISLIYSEDATFVENITLSFYTFNQLVALVAVILFTTILVIQIKKKSAWRMKTSSARSSNSNTVVRDTKIVKMVLFISLVYIMCFVPGAVNIVVMIFVSDYSLIGRYKNICTLVWAKSNIFEAFNSTINIFIYINMSSKYSHAFNKMFGRQSADGEAEGRGSRSKSRNENSSVPIRESKTGSRKGTRTSVAGEIQTDANNASNNNQKY